MHKLNIILATLFVTIVSINVFATEVRDNGYVELGMLNLATDSLDESKTISGLSISDRDTEANVMIGYQINENLSFETGVISNFDISITGDPTVIETATRDGMSVGDYDINAKVDTGYTLGFKYLTHVNKIFDLYGRAGVYIWNATSSYTHTEWLLFKGSRTAGTTFNINHNDNGNDLYYSIGGSYRVNKTTSINVDYSKINIDYSKINSPFSTIKVDNLDAEGFGLAIVFDF
jgi:hypothetical protein